MLSKHLNKTVISIRILILQLLILNTVFAEWKPVPEFNESTCEFIGGEYVYRADELGFEDQLGNYVVITAYLNHANTTGLYNSFYQCTELTGAACNISYGSKYQLVKDITKATQGYVSGKNGFRPRYSTPDKGPCIDYVNNDGSISTVDLLLIKPESAKVGDIIVENNNHVAVIKQNDNGMLTLIEQNYVDKTKKYYALNRKIEANSVKIYRVNPIGCYYNGWNRDGSSKAFVNTFNKYIDKIGVPFDNGGGVYVHFWQGNDGGVLIQDLEQNDLTKPHFGDDGQTSLVLNERLNETFLLHDGFWGFFKMHNGRSNLLAPKSEEYLSDKITRQDFEKEGKWLEWNGKEVILHDKNEELVPRHKINIISSDMSMKSISSQCKIYSNGVFIGETPLLCDLYEKHFYTFIAQENDNKKEFSFRVGLKDTTLNTNQINSDSPFKLGKVVTCSSVCEGAQEWSMLPVGESDIFTQGKDIIGFFELKDIYRSNICKVDIFYNGEHSWTYGDEYWNDINNVWSFIYLLPEQATALPGIYTFKAFISYSKNPKTYNLIDSISCKVLPDTNAPYYVLTKAVTCTDVEDGNIEWSKVPVNVTDTFFQGTDVIGFFELRNVTKSNICKVDVYYNNVYSWTYGDEYWNNLNSMWSYLYLLPKQANTLPGEYTFKAFISFSQNPKDYMLIDTVSCYIKADVTGIKSPGKIVSFKQNANSLKVIYLQKNTTMSIKLYNLNGKLVFSKENDTSGCLVYDYDKVGNGLYIMHICIHNSHKRKTNNYIHKILINK